MSFKSYLLKKAIRLLVGVVVSMKTSVACAVSHYIPEMIRCGQISVVHAHTLVNGSNRPYVFQGKFSGTLAAPAPNDFQPFMQNTSDGACALYSILGAALQTPALRNLLEKTLVHQDQDFAYFKFPDLEASLSHLSWLKEANNKIYKVAKEIHTGDLLPGTHPWVNLFSKAYFEYIHEAGSGVGDSYQMLTFDMQGNPVNLLFGRVVEIIPLYSHVIKVVQQGGQLSAQIALLLGQDGTLKGMSDRLGPVEVKVNQNLMIALPSGGHARSAFFVPNVGWAFFDNQDRSGPKSGDMQLLEGLMNQSDYAELITMNDL